MRYLFVLVLTFSPLSVHMDDLIAFSADGIDLKTTERSTTETPSGDEDFGYQPWPYANPYHPTSSTNFDVFATPLSPSSGGHDRSRLSLYLSDSGPNPAIYGHFGSPFFPDSVNRRNETDHPYALDSPTNQYGRSWFMEKR